MIGQLAVMALSVIGVLLLQSPRANARWLGCIAGLAAQPFWIAATWDAKQYGMFIASIVFTLVWARGIWINWKSES